jgi:hypothetical protein
MSHPIKYVLAFQDSLLILSLVMWPHHNEVYITMQMMGYEKYHMVQWKEGRLIVLLQNHE